MDAILAHELTGGHATLTLPAGNYQFLGHETHVAGQGYVQQMCLDHEADVELTWVGALQVWFTVYQPPLLLGVHAGTPTPGTSHRYAYVPALAPGEYRLLPTRGVRLMRVDHHPATTFTGGRDEVLLEWSGPGEILVAHESVGVTDRGARSGTLKVKWDMRKNADGRGTGSTKSATEYPADLALHDVTAYAGEVVVARWPARYAVTLPERPERVVVTCRDYNPYMDPQNAFERAEKLRAMQWVNVRLLLEIFSEPEGFIHARDMPEIAHWIMRYDAIMWSIPDCIDFLAGIDMPWSGKADAREEAHAKLRGLV